jgi:predicted RNA binding protein YcfA (HicA-like mRNA interferase family)
MSRFRLTYKDLIETLLAHGFVEKPPRNGSHRKYVGEIAGERKIVTVAPHGHLKAHPAIGTQKSIIRQSGLGKQAFKRK